MLNKTLTTARTGLMTQQKSSFSLRKIFTVAVAAMSLALAATPAAHAQQNFQFGNDGSLLTIEEGTNGQQPVIREYREIVPNFVNTSSETLQNAGCGPNGRRDSKAGTYEIECPQNALGNLQYTQEVPGDSCVGPIQARANRLYGYNPYIFNCSLNGGQMGVILNENFNGDPNLRNEYRDYDKDCQRTSGKLAQRGLTHICRDAITGEQYYVRTPTYQVTPNIPTMPAPQPRQ